MAFICHISVVNDNIIQRSGRRKRIELLASSNDEVGRYGDVVHCIADHVAFTTGLRLRALARADGTTYDPQMELGVRAPDACGGAVTLRCLPGNLVPVPRADTRRTFPQPPVVAWRAG